MTVRGILRGTRDKVSSTFYGDVPPARAHHGAFAGSSIGGLWPVICPQCQKSISTHATADDARRAAAYHNTTFTSPPVTAPGAPPWAGLPTGPNKPAQTKKPEFSWSD